MAISNINLPATDLSIPSIPKVLPSNATRTKIIVKTKQALKVGTFLGASGLLIAGVTHLLKDQKIGPGLKDKGIAEVLKDNINIISASVSSVKKIHPKLTVIGALVFASLGLGYHYFVRCTKSKKKGPIASDSDFGKASIDRDSAASISLLVKEILLRAFL